METIWLGFGLWLFLPALVQGVLYYRHRANFRAWFGLMPFFACALFFFYFALGGAIWPNLFNLFLLWAIGGFLLVWWLAGHFEEWELRGERESGLSMALFVWPLALPISVLIFIY